MWRNAAFSLLQDEYMCLDEAELVGTSARLEQSGFGKLLV
jgi:hypothetical protein